MAGLAGIVGVYFTWRNLAMTQHNMEETQKNTQEQLNTAQAQLRVAQEGQVTERFTKAIDQLGEEDHNDAPRLEIRIGSIYALERLAKHYQEQSSEDYGSIMEILTAYVRENAKWTPNQASGPTLKAHQVAGLLTNIVTPGVRGDIQAALDVLGRRNEKLISEKLRRSLNLVRSDLSGASLSGANLSGADLSQANLSGATLIKANLSGASLEQADLSGAYLSGANLSGASLSETRLEAAVLTTVVLTGNDLEQVRSALGLARQEVGNSLLVEGADLRTAENLTLEQLELALGDSNTKGPDGSASPEAWSNTLVPPSDPPPEPSSLSEWNEAWSEHDKNIEKQKKRIEEHLKQHYE